MALSQGTTATLGGRVTDSGKSVIAGADIAVTSEETGLTTHARTNGAGLWQINSLIAGHYRFTVTAKGFATVEHSAIDLQIADVKSIDITMKVGSINQTVVVTAETPLIDTTAAVSGVVLNSSDIEELPSLTNSPTELAVMAPGVFLAPPTGGAVGLWGSINLSGFNVNGAGSGHSAVNYVLDGATDTIVSNGNIAFIPPSDAVGQMRVMTNAYDASIGRTAAGTINLSLKSGGDKFHGVLYERNQNNFLNANYVQYKATGTPTPTIRFNEWGGTIGGPVLIPKIYNGRRHGTFFFFSYDGIHNVSPAKTAFLSIPNEAERKGDYSQSFTVVNGVKYPITIYDPLTIDAAGNRKPFPNAMIPASRISPMAKALVAMLPLPNVPHTDAGTDANNFLEDNPKVDNFYSWLIRLDHAWNDNNHSYIDWRRNQLRELTNDSFGPHALLLAGQYLNRDNYGLTINHTWVINPNVILSANINGTAWKSSTSSPASSVDPTQYGFSQAFASSQPIRGLPRLTNVLGRSSIGTIVGPQYENDYQWEGHGFVTQIHGTHTFRYGAEYLLSQESEGSNSGGTGILNFSSIWTSPNPNTTAPPGSDTVNPSFLLGLPSSGSITQNTSAFWSQPFVGAFVQDDWRVTPRLTLALGLRWDIQLGLTERHDRYFARFDPNANLAPVTDYAQPRYAALVRGSSNSSGVRFLQQYGSQVSSFQAKGAIQYAGTQGTDRSVGDIRFKYFQPRVGFAYRLTPHLVVRGGVGRFVQPTFIANHGNQLGYSTTTPFIATNDNYRTAASTLDNPFPNGLVAPTGNSLGALTSVGSVSSFFTPKAKRMYTDDVSLRIQQQFGDYLIDIGGVVDRTEGLIVGQQIDDPSIAAWHAAFDPKFDGKGRPVDTLPGNVSVTNPFKGSPYITSSLETASTISAYQLARPNPLVNGMTEDVYAGSSINYALQTRAQRRYRNGFSILASFTWSKQMDETNYFTPSVYSQALHRQLSPDDRRFKIALSSTYILPFGRGKLIGNHVNRFVDKIIGGWELSGIYSFYSGTPIELPTNTAFFEGGDPADGITKSKSQWFNTDKFRPLPNRSTTVAQLAEYPSWTGVQKLPGYGWSPTSSTDKSRNGVYNDFKTWISDNPTTYGTVRNPYINSWNIGIRKNVPISGSVRLQLRLDAFNAFNHPQFGNVDTDPADTYFGWLGGSPVPTQVNVPRAIQLQGKLYF
ncbi:MAG TPA: carboxypeptidase-like regulatory domain-containing protein [Edaphobacter sp.]|nr:carboxypeptidase-like regulatory domain-containing protein [Edaphobacter sp.]